MNCRYFYSTWKITKREPLYSNLKFVSFLLFHGKAFTSTAVVLLLHIWRLQFPKPEVVAVLPTLPVDENPECQPWLQDYTCSVFPCKQLLVPSSLQPVLPWGKQWMPRGSTDVLNMFGTRENSVLLFLVREFHSHLYSERKHLHPDAAHSFHVENMAYSRIHLASNPGFSDLVPAFWYWTLNLKDVWIQSTTPTSYLQKKNLPRLKVMSFGNFQKV